MEILIDQDGALSITRNGVLRKQYCPHSTSARCGDWCPLFEDIINHGALGNPQYSLTLCHTALHFSNYTDNRNKELSG